VSPATPPAANASGRRCCTGPMTAENFDPAAALGLMNPCLPLAVHANLKRLQKC
jgi:hypothetical protein